MQLTEIITLSECIGLCAEFWANSHLKISTLLHDDGESWKAARKDVVVRVLCADMQGGAQEEAPGRAGRLRRVLKEVLGEVEGVCDDTVFSSVGFRPSDILQSLTTKAHIRPHVQQDFSDTRERFWPTGCWFVGGDELTGALHDL